MSGGSGPFPGACPGQESAERTSERRHPWKAAFSTGRILQRGSPEAPKREPRPRHRNTSWNETAYDSAPVRDPLPDEPACRSVRPFVRYSRDALPGEVACFSCPAVDNLNGRGPETGAVRRLKLPGWPEDSPDPGPQSRQTRPQLSARRMCSGTSRAAAPRHRRCRAGSWTAHAAAAYLRQPPDRIQHPRRGPTC